MRGGLLVQMQQYFFITFLGNLMMGRGMERNGDNTSLYTDLPVTCKITASSTEFKNLPLGVLSTSKDFCEVSCSLPYILVVLIVCSMV